MASGGAPFRHPPPGSRAKVRPARYLSVVNDIDPHQLKKSADMMYAALRVFIHSEKLRPMLAVNDPKALEQAVWACAAYSQAVTDQLPPASNPSPAP